MFSRHQSNGEHDGNVGVLSEPIPARIVSAVPPLQLELPDGQRLGLVAAPHRRNTVFGGTEYGRRAEFADFLKDLNSSDEVLGVEHPLSEYDELVKRQELYVAVGSVPLSEAVEQGLDETEVARIVAVEPSIYDRDEPAVYVQGEGESTAVLETGAELLAPRVNVAFDDAEYTPPHVF